MKVKGREEDGVKKGKYGGVRCGYVGVGCKDAHLLHRTGAQGSASARRIQSYWVWTPSPINPGT